MIIDFFVNLLKDIESALHVRANPKGITSKDQQIQNIRIQSIALRVIGCFIIFSGFFYLDSTVKQPSKWFDLGFSGFLIIGGYDSVMMGRNSGDAIARLNPELKENDTWGSVVDKGVNVVSEAIKIQDRSYLYRDTFLANRIYAEWNKIR